MIHANQAVADIVLEHSATAPIFQKHRIDYCCHGDRSLAQAASERGLKLEALKRELEAAISDRKGMDGPDPRELSSPALIGTIVSRHHEYLRRTMPFVRSLSTKVAKVHGGDNPKLHQLEEVVHELVEDLEGHLDMEEQELFPAIMTGKNEEVIKRELKTMHEEHVAVSVLLDAIREHSDDFHLPQGACNSYRTLFGELEAMEGDLLRHVHLENHVLMPRFQ